MELDGEVALITGGGTGIGAAAARRLAAAGAHVAVTGRRPWPLEAVAEELGGLALPGDATSADDVKATIAATRERFGRLDIVVDNAGGHGLGSTLDTPTMKAGRPRGTPTSRQRSWSSARPFPTSSPTAARSSWSPAWPARSLVPRCSAIRPPSTR